MNLKGELLYSLTFLILFVGLIYPPMIIENKAMESWKNEAVFIFNFQQ